jgi:hypothetical protein
VTAERFRWSARKSTAARSIAPEKLSWDDNWSGYGFPVPGNIRDLLAGDDKKYL